jgi:hypothetical protein
MPGADDIERKPRLATGKNLLGRDEEEELALAEPDKIFAADPRGNEEAARAAGVILTPLEPLPPGTPLAFGAPASRAADHLRVLVEPRPWVMLRRP